MDGLGIPGLVLAGGGSTRLGGGDKTLLELDGRPILAHVLERFQPQVSRAAVSANGDTARFASFQLPVLPDLEFGGAGPLAGVLRGMRWADELGAMSVATVPADAPFLPADLVERLASTAAGNAVLARCGGILHPVFALWPIALADDLASYLRSGGRKLRDFATSVDCGYANYPPEDAEHFLNINTPEDLSRARALLAGQIP